MDTPVRPLSVRKEGPFRGGNLSRMIGISRVSAPFEMERPSVVEYADEYGFPNRPPTINRTYPIVVAGDSFMLAPDWMDARMDAQLAARMDLPVYNHSVKGWGAFHGIVRFLLSTRFQVAPPKVLIFGMVEQDIAGASYVGMLHRLEVKDSFVTHAVGGKVVAWGELMPSSLAKSLPSTSVLAQAARKSWNYIRYYIFRRLNPDVVIASNPCCRHPMLFYRYALLASHWPSSVRNIPQVVWALEQVAEICHERGIQLVILLIPDKEQVYREWVPDTWHPLPESCLTPLAQGIADAGIPVVNLLPVFRSQALAGELLYWPDDTHWNPAGIELAAKELAPVVARLLEEGVGGRTSEENATP